MFCRLCDDLDYDQASRPEGAEHYPSFAHLVSAAKSASELCVILRHERETDGDPDFDQVDTQEDTRIRCLYNNLGPALNWRQDGEEDNISIAFLSVCPISYDVFGYLYAVIRRSIIDRICTRLISSDSSFADCFNLIDNWVSECPRYHRDCVNSIEPALPTRVIEIGDEGDGPILSVSQGRHARWVTLSHCWRQVQPMKTELGSLQDRCARIPLNEPPQLFIDALTITRRLGHKYLWIDSLCIIRDSLEDWRKESANMRHVYRNSVLAIAAEACPDSHCGIFESSNTGRLSPLAGQNMVQISCHSSAKRLKGITCKLLRGQDIRDAKRYRGPLSKRAWTLQETILSPCVLRFAHGQVWWQCRAQQSNEHTPYGRDHFETNIWDSGLTPRIGANLFDLSRTVIFVGYKRSK